MGNYVFKTCFANNVDEYIERLKEGYIIIYPNEQSGFTHLFEVLEKRQNEHDNIKHMYASFLFSRDIKKGLDILMTLVDKGHLPSIHVYSRLLISGTCVEKNQDKALELLNFCIDRGYALSTYELAMNYFSGCRGVEKDLDKALHFALMSIDQGYDREGNFLVGRIYTNKEPNLENLQKAIEYYEKMDKDQCPDNKLKQLCYTYERLGNAYINGKYGIEVNISLGNEYVSKSSDLYEYMRNRE